MKLILGDCLEKLKELPDNSVDSVVTDPPYGLGFMNKEWDDPNKLKKNLDHHKQKVDERGQASFSPLPFERYGGKKEGLWFQQWCEEWAKECLRILKPGGHMLSFSAPRMYHRMTSGLEDAGFEIRDQIMWVFGSGFPKSHNIGKAVDKLLGNEREVVGTETTPFKVDNTAANSNCIAGSMNGDFSKQVDENGYRINTITKGNTEWEGWGTALKPAHEPIVVARKPISEKTIAENVLKWGTGAINIDESRIGYKDDKPKGMSNERTNEDSIWKTDSGFYNRTEDWEPNNEGRWPANIILDEEAGKILDEQSDNASRFFYCPKASKKDRDEGLDGFEDKGKGWSDYLSYTTNGISDKLYDRNTVYKNNHPTVKPTKLMEYLIKLVTPKGGTVLDPFMGSGSTGKACKKNGFDFIGIEREEQYIKIAEARINNI